MNLSFNKICDNILNQFSEKLIDLDYIKILSLFLHKKIVSTSINVKSNNWLIQLIRIFKFLYIHLGAKSEMKFELLHLSLPYYIHDVSNIPSFTRKLSEMKINILDCIKILIIYLFLMISKRNNEIENETYLNSCICIAIIFYYGIKRANVKTLHFHSYSFVPDVAALIHILSSDIAIECHYHDYIGFICDADSIVTNCLHNTNEITSSFAKKHPKIYSSERYLFNTSLKNIQANFYRQKKRLNTLGVYSSGFYCRLNHGYYKNELVKEGIKKENQMFSMVYKFASMYPSFEIIIFIHDIRGVEDYDTALKHYKKMLALPNVSLFDSKNVPGSPHHKIELGMTVISGVFWDRVLNGNKTILFEPIISNKIINSTGLKNVVIRNNQDHAIEEIVRFLNMDGPEYVALLLDGGHKQCDKAFK